MKPTQSRLNRTILFFVVAAIGLALDLGTKHWIFAELGKPGERPVRWIVDDVFGFQTSLNQGALFGIGQGQIPLFVSLSILALAGIVWWVWTDVVKSRYLAITLGLIAAGIIGNLWDRIGLHQMKWTEFDCEVWNCDPECIGQPIYAVRDWILVMIGSYPWPNFNIADSCLVCGAILVGAYALFAPNPDLAKFAQEAAENDEAKEGPKEE